MPLVDPAEMKRLLPRGRRLIGLDLGTKTIGTALSDGLLMVASPLETLKRARFSDDWTALLALIRRHEVGGLVLGLPLNMDGSEGPRVQATRAFARNVMAQMDLPIVLWDERLSTAAVERGMIEADMSRKRRAQVVDRAAAAYILQGLLDRLRYLPDMGSPSS
ncbi:MAG TPA: Holliday junction resolvase RuvX [Stellaceae bacterium]|jgi:putative Holliday junction resolvase|nr:Holliday junction resolvase RuvX [Stellaceae bacterium]